MDYAQQQRNPARHLVGLTIVVLLHALLGWAIVNGLARKVVDVIKQPFETKIVEEHKPPPPPEAPPPPPPKVAVPPPPFIPPPEIQIAVAPPVANTISQVTNKAPPAPVAPVIAKPAPKPSSGPTRARIKAGSCASDKPPYPAASRRNEEAGSAVLRIAFDASGTPTKVDFVKSFGHNRLDESARNWVMTCKLVPPTIDGQAVAGSADLPLEFRLQD
jgi:protein TonB